MQNARNRGGPDTMWAAGHEPEAHTKAAKRRKECSRRKPWVTKIEITKPGGAKEDCARLLSGYS
jgi:hypothetical protein